MNDLRSGGFLTVESEREAVRVKGFGGDETEVRAGVVGGRLKRRWSFDVDLMVV